MNTELMGYYALAMVWILPTAFIAWGLVVNITSIFRSDRGWEDLIYISAFVYAAILWMLFTGHVWGRILGRPLIEVLWGI